MDHNIEPYIPTQHASELSDDAQTFVETFFADGPLGVTLRRRPEDGIVFIYEVIPNSQAISLDVQPNDELWAVGESEIGTTPLDKEAWNGLITFIKQSSRPLRLVWRRLAPVQHPPITSPIAESNAKYLLELQKLVERFVTRDRENYRKLLMIEPSKIPTDERRIIKQGDFVVESRQNNAKLLNGGIWSKSNNNRRVTLCNDLLIITVPLNGNVFGVEYILELATCKLRSLGHAFGVHLDTAVTSSIITNCSFDLIYPGGELQITTEDPSAKEVWVLNIYLAMCECVDPSSRVLGWRHQYLLGTMHSAVILRDEDRVKELISLCDNHQLDFLSIEAPDEDGYTPLHYACMLRLHGMVKLLHDATADVTVADRFGLTPLHWAALQLDDYSLSLLSTHVFNIDLEDNFGRTPLVLACIEGRDISGKSDSVLVRKCLECLLSHKPNLHFCDSKGQTLLHYLSASWQWEAIEILLDAGCTDVNSVDNRYYMSPLHYAAHGAPIKLSSGDGMRIISGSGNVGISLSPPENAEVQYEDRQYRGGLDTMRVLLQYGAKPNQKDIQGRTPLMVILESDNMTKEEQESGIAVLLSHGARVDDVTNALSNNSQSVQNLLRSKFPDLNVAAFVEKWNLLPSLDCSKLNIRQNHFEPVLQADGSSSGPNNSSGSACNLCGFQFTLFRRQHHCRLCNSPICDDCSRKRVIVDGNQVRSCDCCYNRILHVQKKYNKLELLKSKTSNPVDTTIRPPSATQSEKSKLLGTFAAQEKIVNKKDSTQKSLSSTFGVLNETSEQLQQRGEKLSQLSDRTADMANQANEFARLAKQLNEQQKSRWF